MNHQPRALLGIDATIGAKFDRRLREEIAAHSDAPAVALPVMISLAGPPAVDRTLPIDEKQLRFAEAAKEVWALIGQLGARNISGFWINWTIAAEVPVVALPVIAERSEVTQILLVERHKAVS